MKDEKLSVGDWYTRPFEHAVWILYVLRRRLYFFQFIFPPYRLFLIASENRMNENQLKLERWKVELKGKRKSNPVKVKV